MSEISFEQYMADKMDRRKRFNTPGAFGKTGKPKRHRKTPRQRLFDLRIRKANFMNVIRKKGKEVELQRIQEAIAEYRKEVSK